MHIDIQLGAIDKFQADAVVLNAFEGATKLGGATGAVDRALDGLLTEILASGDFKGKVGETGVIYTRGALASPRIILVGLGKADEFSATIARRASAAAARKAQDMGLKHIASVVHGAGAGGLEASEAAQAVAEGAALVTYRFSDYKSGANKPSLEQLTLVELDPEKIAAERAGAQAGETLANAVCLARNLVNRPPNYLTPTMMGEMAQAMAEANPKLKVTVLDREAIARLGMGALLGVAQGSDEPPRFIILEHGPQDEPPVVIIGKGITFDSGGISLKPAVGMEEMKGDMAGAAAVLGAMQAVGDLDLPLHVVALVPSTENLPGGRAVKPADVVRAMNGKTIEINNTDAEGRLVLADALSYATTLTPPPQALIDLATLTGAIFIALGRAAAGLFSNNDALADRLYKAGEHTGERVWRLPLYPEYREIIDSDVADMKNSAGVARGPAGAAVGAMFIREFVSNYPWAHLDIASMTYHSKASDLGPKGGTGYGVRLLVDLLRNWTPLEGSM
ncbi:MAG: leucyl aminopeptidase [Anaerolineae bacterium]